MKLHTLHHSESAKIVTLWLIRIIPTYVRIRVGTLVDIEIRDRNSSKTDLQTKLERG